MNPGLWVSPTEFVSFSQQGAPLDKQLATRMAAGDLSALFGLLPNPDPILKQMGRDITVYRNLLVDPLIKGARRRRIAAVTALESGFDPEKCKGVPARVLKACEAMLAGLDMQRVVRDQIDGAFFGYRVSEVVWGQSAAGAVPLDLIAKPSEWFGFDDDGRLKFKPLRSPQGVDVPDRQFVVAGKMRNWENPYGEPDLAACFWPVTFKRGGLKFWVTFTEKYGMPWAVGKLPRSASPAETNDLAVKLEAMVRDAVAVIPEDASVELLTTSGTANAEMFERLVMFCRSEISIALLGNNQSVEKEANRASAMAAQNVEADLRDDDGQIVAAAINCLVRYYCEVNYPGVKPPVFGFWEQEEVDEMLAKRDSGLKAAGARFTPQYFKRAYKLEEGDLDETPEPAEPATGDGGAHLRLVPPGKRAAGERTASFADVALPPDQAAIDAAIAQLPEADIEAAMRDMLAPALRAIGAADTPDEVRQALVDAWPEMDAGRLQALMEQAYFVADLVGRDAVKERT